MQVLQPKLPGAIEPAGNAPPVSVDASDHLDPVREEALLLLMPHRERFTTACMLAGALVIGVGVGWAGCLGWNSYAVVAGSPAAKEPPVRHAETRPASRTESIRRQAPSVTASINASKPPAAVLRAEPEPKSAAAILGSLTASEPRPLLMPAPETRPTTIEGWTVVDVRGQTAVLQGPDGVHTVTPGETVPGVGRIDSIVRWGNRWIVATGNGLIAAP